MEPLNDSPVIHGYRPTDTECPYCHASYGMRERTDDPAVVLYRCWCGAKRREPADA